MSDQPRDSEGNFAKADNGMDDDETSNVNERWVFTNDVVGIMLLSVLGLGVFLSIILGHAVPQWLSTAFVGAAGMAGAWMFKEGGPGSSGGGGSQ